MAELKTPPLVELIGQVERITYNNDQSGFTVAQIQVAGYADLVTAVGILDAPSPGAILNIKGYWRRHADFGKQFQTVHCQVKMPVTKQGIEKYLGSGLIDGIGPAMARRIVHQFGKQTLEIIDKDPEQLKRIHGIGTKRALVIQRAWQKHAQSRQAMLFLQSHGIGASRAIKIIQRYGQRTVSLVQQNPYRLARDIFGIGFMTADRMAAQLGLDRCSPIRLRAGIRHVLSQTTDDGHLCYPYEGLVTKSQTLLKTDREATISGIEALAKDRQVIIDDIETAGNEKTNRTQAVYLNHLHQCETFTAQRLQQLLAAPLSRKTRHPQNALTRIQQQLDMELAPGQQKAVAAALTCKVLVITGGPGTGKTTIVRAITGLFESMQQRVLLAAPTGRAAKRLSDATQRPAKTIHRLLEYNPHQGKFHRDEHHPLQGDLLVVDEASMIDMVLMYHLMKAVPSQATLIFVGDVNQLPSVGPGNVLNDMLACKTIPRVALTEIFRQARSSRIVVNAHRINAGRMPQMASVPANQVSDFYFIEQNDPEKILNTILTLAGERIPRRFGLNPLDDIQVLTPMYRGVVGADHLNTALQKQLNPQEAYITRGEQRFSLHDKVMQIRNNYDKEIFNGDIGRIAQIEPHRRKVIIRFDDRMVSFDFEELNEVVLAYAVTVHKSQGSEYPAVIIPVTTQHYVLLQRNLIYTAITRAKQLVVLVGTRRALAMAIQNDKHHQRYTGLAKRLAA